MIIASSRRHAQQLSLGLNGLCMHTVSVLFQRQTSRDMPAYNVPIPVVKLAALLGPLISLSTSTTILSFSFLQAPILREIAKDDSVTALKHIRWYFETGTFRSICSGWDAR